jgi:hypothetical protein
VVQRATFLFAHDAHRDLGVIGQGVANGAGNRMAGQGSAVTRHIRDVTKLQGQLKLLQGHGRSR